MSSMVDTKEEVARSRIRPKGDEGTSNRRRRPTRKPKNVNGNEATEENKIVKVPTEKKERSASIPVPSDFIGQAKEGVVTAIIKRGRFGFIHICPGPEIDINSPKIYFSFSALNKSGLFLRRGYQVSFTCNLDEKERAFATDLKLTEAGKKLADEQDAAYNEKKSQLKETVNNEEEKPVVKRERKVRKPLEDKPVTLKVTCEGKSETKVLTFNKSNSIGKLKNIAVVAFEAPLEYNVFHGDTFLTKSIFIGLSDNDSIHLASPKVENA